MELIRPRWVRRGLIRAVTLLAMLVLIGPPGPAAGGGVAILGTQLSDNGDDDGFADTQETVTMRLVVRNTSGQALSGVVARLFTTDGAIACLTTSEITIGNFAVDEQRTTSEGFVFVVPADVNRTTEFEELFASFEVEITSNEISDLALRQEIVLDLDLDVSGGSDPSSFFEDFENPHGHYAQFDPMNLDEGLHDGTSGDCCGGLTSGYRCRNSLTPHCGATCGYLSCTLGVSDAAADALWWQIDKSNSPGGGRAFSGGKSLYMGAYGAIHPFTTPLGVLEAMQTGEPIHIGWDRVCETTRTTACTGSGDCPTGESCVDVIPVFTFKQQISLMDSRFSNVSPGEAADRGVVQAQFADGAGIPVGDWFRIEPYYNIYDQQATDDFTDGASCMFDPMDDGSSEWDELDPGFSRLGPSSSCFPEYAFVWLGDTDDPFDATNIGNAGDGPGLQGSLGPGTWVESRFSLARFRGRSIRIRFLNSSIRADYAALYEEWFEEDVAADDGWWIDDVSVSDTIDNRATAAPDTHDNSSLPLDLPDAEGDGVFDNCDNCAATFNADQSDLDGDRVGDWCDICPRESPDDFDGDGLCAPLDNCPVLPNPGQEDRDDDALGDPCDNCPDTPNPDQQQHHDADGIPCPTDNCPFLTNFGQEDDDDDDVGNPCDVCPADPLNDDDEDGICHGEDICPDRSNPQQGVSMILVDGYDRTTSLRIAPDDDLVLFVQRLSSFEDLASVRISSGELTILNDPNVVLGKVKPRFDLTGDGGTVVYIFDEHWPVDHNRLYAVPIEGGASTVLNLPLTDGEIVYEDFKISPDDSRVVFRARELSSEPLTELFSVPITGTMPTRLNDPLVTGHDVTSFAVSPDGTRVVYRVDQDSDDVFELYSVPINGGTPIRLNPTLPAGGDVANDEYQISPDSAGVVYLADQDLDEVFELYRVPIEGGTAIKLNSPLSPGRSVLTSPGGFRISPDGARVVYAVDQAADEQWELFSAPTTGGTSVRLNAPLGPDRDIRFTDTQAFEISSDSARVVYMADQDADEVDELFSVSITGGATTKLNGPLPTGADVETGYLISADAATVVYRADQETVSLVELFAAPIAGGSTIRLSDPAITGSVEPDVRISADSSRVLYKIRLGIWASGLYNAPLSGGASVELTDGLRINDFDNALYAMDSDGSTTVWDETGGEDLRASNWNFDEDGDAVPVYCDNCLEVVNPTQDDGDGDGAGTACDCDDADANTYPGAVEINDGLDNQCPGNAGYGIADETTGMSGFFNPADRNEYSWTAQQGATSYDVTRSTEPDFSSGCVTLTIANTFWIDTEAPTPGVVFHYLNRPAAPNPGSWGQDSEGAERTSICP